MRPPGLFAGNEHHASEVSAPVGRIPVLYVAPWLDFGGSDKGTIDWFRWLNRDRFVPSLITTQPSANRRLAEVCPFADEVWVLPEIMAGSQFAGFIFDFLQTREVRVLHIMNSRLAYELLPDLTCLDRPPAVVVQLHVEEPDRSGYVRYVTTRYGNLVHGFSVSSRHLAQALEGYDVPRSRIHVIPTGVDAEQEFNPQRVVPLCSPEPGLTRILFAGRLAEQKDPRLMVEVVRRVLARNDRVRVDVVGDGPLEPEVRRHVRELRLERHVQFHPPTPDLARWLASSDLLLMTSTFEGVPYLVYEALAMEVPVVAPALPGNVELMGKTGGQLIELRDDPDAYAGAIGALIEDEPARRKLAADGRARMLESFTLPQMAQGHEALYDSLLRERGPAPAIPSPVVAPASPIRFTSRPVNRAPLVSVVTPCFNHGRYFDGFLAGFAAQDYPALELIVVDDGSTDPETIDALARLEAEGSAQILRQPANRGPSAARNRAIDAAGGRYILPVDADNVLVAGAVGSLVAQLQSAGERIGFIYPSVRYFGNRDYTFRPPAYNLHALLHGNFVDTCSLLDRDIFDAGLRYAEDIELGHEDWDLALELASRDVLGEPSREIVLLYRKQGFTRSDLVEYMRLPFWREIQERHRELFGGPDDVGGWGRYKGPGLRVKTRWSPALAVIASEAIDFGGESGAELLRCLSRQTCRDFELIGECPRAPEHPDVVVRRLPPGLSASSAERVEEAIDTTRARYLLLTHSPLDLLRDPTIVEKLLRSFWIDLELDAVAFADVGPAAGRFPFALLERAEREFSAHSVAWRAQLHARLGSIELTAGREPESLARAIHRLVPGVQWRHYPSAPRPSDTPGQGRRKIMLERQHPARVASEPVRSERAARLAVAPAIPAVREGQVRRWNGMPAWMPPETRILVRHVSADRSRRVITNDRRPPPGYEIEFDLGSIQQFAPPGTSRLIRRDEHFLTVPRGSRRDDDDEELGHLEEAPLPLFIGIERAILDDGTETLVAAVERDPVRSQARELTFLGFIESFPNEPVRLPAYTERPEEPVLLRWLDRVARRHVHGVVFPSASGEHPLPVSAELGRLRFEAEANSVALRVDEYGRLFTERTPATAPGPDPVQILRWAAAPLGWFGFGGLQGRLRCSARRTVDGARLLLAPQRPGQTNSTRSAAALAAPRVLGYLRSDPEPGTAELFLATHPVTGDQYVTHHRREAGDMGYACVRSLGYIEAKAPVTGTLGSRGLAVPWASRFGLLARRD
ncbi:MAG: glycosyltransferase [Solirubrobacteraceae bacterium]